MGGRFGLEYAGLVGLNHDFCVRCYILLMIRQGPFWRRFATTLAILITLSVVANLFFENVVPFQITLLLFGSLVALGVGYTIENPQSSTVRLTQREEKRFRKRQYRISFVFSTALALSMLLKDVRDSAFVWLFLPIIILPVILVFRGWVKHG